MQSFGSNELSFSQDLEMIKREKETSEKTKPMSLKTPFLYQIYLYKCVSAST